MQRHRWLALLGAGALVLSSTMVSYARPDDAAFLGTYELDGKYSNQRQTKVMELKVEKTELSLSGQSVGRGEARARMECAFKGAPSAEISFNPDYLLEGLKQCEGSMVKLEFNEKTSPGKFTLGENYVYIVMPSTVDV